MSLWTFPLSSSNQTGNFVPVAVLSIQQTIRRVSVFSDKLLRLAVQLQHRAQPNGIVVERQFVSLQMPVHFAEQCLPLFQIDLVGCLCA